MSTLIINSQGFHFILTEPNDDLIRAKRYLKDSTDFWLVSTVIIADDDNPGFATTTFYTYWALDYFETSEQLTIRPFSQWYPYYTWSLPRMAFSVDLLLSVIVLSVSNTKDIGQSRIILRKILTKNKHIENHIQQGGCLWLNHC